MLVEAKETAWDRRRRPETQRSDRKEFRETVANGKHDKVEHLEKGEETPKRKEILHRWSLTAGLHDAEFVIKEVYRVLVNPEPQEVSLS